MTPAIGRRLRIKAAIVQAATATVQGREQNGQKTGLWIDRMGWDGSMHRRFIMNITYSDKIKEGSPGFSLLQQATALLEEIIGRSSVQAKAEWDREADKRGRVVYTLRLTDSTGEVSAAFTPAELRSSSLRFRCWPARRSPGLPNRVRHVFCLDAPSLA